MRNFNLIQSDLSASGPSTFLSSSLWKQKEWRILAHRKRQSSGKFGKLPGKKNVVADALSRLDIDSLKIQEEEVLTLLSGSENNSIINIKSTIPMHTALIFKEPPNSRD
jgi:hypothetical protein